MSSDEQGARQRTGIVVTLLILASVIGFLSIFALWAKRQLLETDTWTNTSSRMLENQEIRDQVSTFLVDQLFNNVNVQAKLDKALPPQAKPLAGPAAGGLRQFADTAAPKLLEQPRVQGLWENANRSAHKQLLAIVEGKSGVISQQNGVVALDLRVLISQLAQETGLPNVADKIPEDEAQIVILRSSQLAAAQDVVNILRIAAWALVLVTLALYALAVYLATNWRREALRSVGISFIAVGIAVLIARGIVGNVVVGSLATTASVQPAAHAAWSIGTSVLAETAGSVLLYGVLIIIAAWIAGTTRPATSFRREIAPYYREPLYAYASTVVIIAILLAWHPTDGLTRVGPSLLLILFMAIGTEFLRRQIIREFPDQTPEVGAQRWNERMEGFRGMAKRTGERFDQGGGPVSAEDDKLARLERLGKLRSDGVLTEKEFEAEKQAILAG
jgi:hypothetical protein